MDIEYRLHERLLLPNSPVKHRLQVDKTGEESALQEASRVRLSEYSGGLLESPSMLPVASLCARAEPPSIA